MAGKHPHNALNAVQVRQLKTPGRYADGNGLYLVVDPSGARRWLVRIVVNGRRRDIGLGGTTLVTLAEAREQALAYRRIARSGGDPLQVRDRQIKKVPSFSEAAEAAHQSRVGTWKNPKHAQQWITTLRDYAFPFLGDLSVAEITTPNILTVLGPIWLLKPETARRVKQRIAVVLDWAKAAGHRTGDNPVAGVASGLPKHVDSSEHHRALPYDQVPNFVRRLRAGVPEGEVARLAFEFLILTASRTSEAILARKSEVDVVAGLWVVPAARMKAKKEHRVPLSKRAIEVVHRASLLGADSQYLFPGRLSTRPMSNMVLLAMLRRMDVDATAHGFRSSFRDWAAETTSFPRELAEMALAHTIESKVEAAYRRGDLLAKRAGDDGAVGQIL